MSKEPIVKKRRLVKVGGSYYISIPKAWLDAHNINPDEEEDPKLLMVANKDIRIVNPVHEDEVYKDVTKITKEADI